MLRALGYRGNVKSPTYTLVELYSVSKLNFYHFDFYRFDYEEEYLDAGLDEYFRGQGLCLVEWPERAGAYVPAPDLRITLTFEGTGRRAVVEACTDEGLACLSALDLPRETGSPDSPIAPG
jgi:tRNA threonylcarbamoyladenosine biosynthesis protein TsaE